MFYNVKRIEMCPIDKSTQNKMYGKPENRNQIVAQLTIEKREKKVRDPQNHLKR